ncbi:hypothetical protein DL96DRAFT_1574775 [Flagelloscypha sp. PMI_526]|nr:hypothetical protein DL96DRAFT_1574775 [Flagelloscypha sp. PMI_526]
MHNAPHRDTTVVLLNWSRFPNVQRIVNSLCHELDDFLEGIIVWNNNPSQDVTKQDFAPNCRALLTIFNSPSNEFFKARYLACASTSSDYCFFQDDDFLVQPSVIRTMRASNTKLLSPIYLAPPHEAMTSRLRTVIVGETVHTSMAWLGYGSLVSKSAVLEFLELMNSLNMTEEEQKMADNYFSILKNELPEVWTVVPPMLTELGGGQAFTVGSDGDKRNAIHMLKAAAYLDNILKSGTPKSSFVHMLPEISHNPYVLRTPCANNTCLVEFSQARPSISGIQPRGAQDILNLEESQMNRVSVHWMENTLVKSLSHAVDGDLHSAFQSPVDVDLGDMLLFRLLGSLNSPKAITIHTEFTTAEVLVNSVWEISDDCLLWVSSIFSLKF